MIVYDKVKITFWQKGNRILFDIELKNEGSISFVLDGDASLDLGHKLIEAGREANGWAKCEEEEE